MKSSTLTSIVREILKKHLSEQPTPPTNPEASVDLTPIEPGPGQETEQEPEPETPEADTPEAPAGNITKEQAKQLIKDTKGKFFTVTFTKKDGTTRVMNARLGVKAFLKGGELPYDPSAKGLIPVYDMQKHEYRIVNFLTISKLKIGNNEYNVL